MLGIIAGLVVGEGRGSGNEHLYPNVNEADLMKWKVKNVSLATSPHAGSALGLLQRAKQELMGVG